MYYFDLFKPVMTLEFIKYCGKNCALRSACFNAYAERDPCKFAYYFHFVDVHEAVICFHPDFFVKRNFYLSLWNFAQTGDCFFFLNITKPSSCKGHGRVGFSNVS